MPFAAPIWLVAVLPWIALVAYLLWGRRKRVDVPFLALWKEDITRPQKRRAMERPPLALAMALLALLLMILAAARPGLKRAAGPPMTVIVDRGMSMSAGYPGAPRFAQLARAVNDAILAEFGQGPMNLLTVPPLDPIATDRAAWPRLAGQFPPTAIDTRVELAKAISHALTQTVGPVIVLSDQPLVIDHERLIRIAPATQPANSGIVHVAAREHPFAQILVRVRGSGVGKIVVESASGEAPEKALDRSEQITALGGEEADLFLPLPRGGSVISVRLEPEDSLPFDNRAWLVREPIHPRIEARTALPPAVQRIIEQYTKLRPPGEGSVRVGVWAVEPGKPLPMEPGVMLALAGPLPLQARPAARLTAAEHPIAANIGQWEEALGPVTVVPPPPGADWKPVLQSPEGVLIAARDNPRQVWVGFTSETFASSLQFVMLWSNMLGWLSPGDGEFAWHAVETLEAGWEPLVAGSRSRQLPGLYRRSDGAIRAANTLGIAIPPASPDDWRGRLAELAARSGPADGRVLLSGPLMLLALACLGVSALTWGTRVKRADPDRMGVKGKSAEASS